MNDKLNFIHDKHFYFISAIQLNINLANFLFFFIFFFFFWWFILLVQDDNDDDDDNKSSDFLSKFFF